MPAPRKTTARSKRAPTAPRKLPRQARAQETVEAILEATARVLRTQGYEGLTTNKVADAAGVSVGSLYQYFPGKEALVTAVLVRFAERQQVAFFDVISKVAAAPIPVVIDAVVEMLIEQTERDPELATVLMTQLPRIGELGEVIAYTEEKIATPLHAFLVARQADLAPTDLRAATFLLTHSIPPLLQRMRVSAPPIALRRAVFRELKQMLVGYFVGAGVGGR